MKTHSPVQGKITNPVLAATISLTLGLTAILPVEPLHALPYGQHNQQQQDHGGLLYVMDNDVEGNRILVFSRNPRGELSPLPHADIATGGLGGSSNAAIDPLGSQNSLIYDSTRNLLVGVNAGDNSVFAMDTGGNRGNAPAQRNLQPTPTALVNSGGQIPVSVAISGDRLYVLNAGGHGAVSTFAISNDGELALLDILQLDLDNATTLPFNNVMAPGQVGVDTLARRILVTNAAGQELLSTALDDAGIPDSEIIATPTSGVVPFSFDTTPFGNILVTEAGSGAVSAFDSPAGNLPLIATAASIGNGQAATCWIVAHDNGFAFVSNTASDTVSLYHYTRNGELTLVEAEAATTGSAPIDMTLASNGRFLYTLDAGSGEISGFEVDPENGTLTALAVTPGLPAGLGIQGIAARDF